MARQKRLLPDYFVSDVTSYIKIVRVAGSRRSPYHHKITEALQRCLSDLCISDEDFPIPVVQDNLVHVGWDKFIKEKEKPQYYGELSCIVLPDNVTPDKALEILEPVLAGLVTLDPDLSIPDVNFDDLDLNIDWIWGDAFSEQSNAGSEEGGDSGVP